MAANESLILDGIELSPAAGTPYRLTELLMPPPKKRYEWAGGGDADGSALVRDPLHDNREITAQIECASLTRDTALGQIGAVIDKLEEAERTPDGLSLVWTPSNATKSVTFKVLSGEVTELPTDATYAFGKLIRFTVVFQCKPFGYGTEVVGAPSSSSTPFVTLTVAGVTGDVPAEGRLIVTDAATQARRYLEWGVEQRYYDSATSLIVESDNMVTTATGGTQTTRTGAYDPNATGNNVIRGTLWRGVVAIAATGNLGHVGTFRVKARVYGSGTGPIYTRLSWQDGDSPYRANQYVRVHMLETFVEVDLGTITIPPKDLGTQRWAGRVEAYSMTPGDTLDVDYLVLVPAGEGYGKARGVGSTVAASVNGYDELHLAPAAVLNARVAPAGGTWATSGVATDFAGSSDGLQAMRSTVSETSFRYAILGATNYTDSQVEVFASYLATSSVPGIYSGVIARWTDANNFLYAQWVVTSPGVTGAFRINQVVAGTATTLAQADGYYAPNTGYGIKLTAYASGLAVAELRIGSGASSPVMVLRGQSSAIATGGALATGKPGFLDRNASAVAGASRLYSFFNIAAPVAEPLVINSTRGLEVRSDTTIRADSTNTYWGPVPAYRGSRFLLPPAGSAGRTARVLVKAHRQDIETLDAANVTDNLTAQVAYTPRWLVVPR